MPEIEDGCAGALESLAGAMSPAEEATALPFAAYRDQALFDLEMEQLFRGDWVAVCPANALSEAGDYLALNIGGEPIAVVRGEDGELRALSTSVDTAARSCWSLASTVSRAARSSVRITPGVTTTPACSGVRRTLTDYGSIRRNTACRSSASKSGWAWSSSASIPTRSHCRSAWTASRPRLAEFDMPGYRVAGPLAAPEVWDANWKLILENGMESYHLFQVHKDTLEQITPTRGAYYIEGSAAWTLTGGEIVQESGSGIVSQLLNRLFWSSSGGDHYTLVSIPPSFVGVVTDESWDWIVVHPNGPTSTNVFQGSLTKQAIDQVSQRIAEGYASAFLEEDRAICERAQVGMASRHSQGGRLVPVERVVVDFHHYLGWRLTGQQPPAPHVEVRR